MDISPGISTEDLIRKLEEEYRQHELLRHEYATASQERRQELRDEASAGLTILEEQERLSKNPDITQSRPRVLLALASVIPELEKRLDKVNRSRIARCKQAGEWVF
jgi:hypothetical protein